MEDREVGQRKRLDSQERKVKQTRGQSEMGRQMRKKQIQDYKNTR